MLIEILRALTTAPIPLILLLTVGVLFWRRPILGRFLVTVTAFALFAMCLPVVGRWLETPLRHAAPLYDAADTGAATVILVPTAGIFVDATGVWWPSSEGIMRAASGRKFRDATGMPLLIAGGSPRGEGISEAVATARAVGLVAYNDRPVSGVYLETTAQNSAETAAAVGPILNRLGADHVVLITAPRHVARMAASLRRYGYRVSSHIDRRAAPSDHPFGALSPFLPSADGLFRSTGAAREYVGILWYLLNGHLTVSDLRLGSPIAGSRGAE